MSATSIFFGVFIGLIALIVGAGVAMLTWAYLNDPATFWAIVLYGGSFLAVSVTASLWYYHKYEK